MTSKTIDWLNTNRFRAYPFVNDTGLVSSGTRIPNCVLLDCQVMDTRHDIGLPELIFTKIDVSKERTVIEFNYDGRAYSHTLYAPSSDSSSSSDDKFVPDENNYVKLSGYIPSGFPDQFVHLSLTFSSHSYIYDNVGAGTWSFHGKVLPSKVIIVTASGVSGIVTNGSKNIQSAGTAIGNVHLIDGYRTQPVIQNGKVNVKVGTHYGYDPCHYDDTDSSSSDEKVVNNCSELMFFFCGQNAITAGDVSLEGGPGVTIIQGGEYEAKEDIIDTYGKVGFAKGEKIPCIEIIASSALLNIYRPTILDSGSNGSSDSSDVG